ncbi:GTPase [Gramella sp. AN32]|uniref:GTPase n=1 Tax=Christiangramia antarctica TaxID=2058158 RepID=A0ABW5XB12_9FLAO|nr:GTPase [Gramella sp. AN32]MCM4155836.1 GTPase [Gramella sp. AN32]
MEKLIFVYNADSGKMNALLDSIHKTLKPKTYSCKLYALTFGKFSEKKNWKQFRETSEVEMEFLHRDEFKKQYASKFGYKFKFPVILVANNKGFELLVPSEEMEKIENEMELIEVIESRL